MSIQQMIDEFEAIASHSGISIVDRSIQQGIPGDKSQIPNGLHPNVKGYLESLYNGSLYKHQSSAIEAILAGSDVCLATPTASGKSLVFMANAMNILLENPKATVLALYPIKALIQDQVSKWNKIAGALDLPIGYIDGSVDTSTRLSILRNDRVVLMTPDVLHAWMMANLRKDEVARFVANLKFLVLDEAHVYSGVFGSNMAYLLRRLQAVSGIERIVTSTATIGDPGDFIESLTGRRPKVFTEADDTAPKPPKAVLLASSGGDSFKNLVKFVIEVSRRGTGKFIAFGDSRRLVETFVAATRRSREDSVSASESDQRVNTAEDEILDELEHFNILPYRAGYEEEDRRAIQNALESGALSGVVATSGLELGIDIGDITTVILLGTPSSIQAFRQRLGRVGRTSEGVCILVDSRGVVGALPGGLAEYLSMEAEKGWLYLENRYIQYTNALCAAAEVASGPQFDPTPFKTLPARFLSHVNNEIEPTTQLDQDFFTLKQRAQSGPHFEFPVRSGIEKTYSVRLRQGPNVHPLGTLSNSQMLREGYPGAVYYYMARPHRVVSVNHRHGEIEVRRESHYTTKPTLQNKVFPKFPNGAINMVKSDKGYLAEAELQVSERVLGFIETRGGARTPVIYGKGSIYSEKPLMRMFETTGVCWSIPGLPTLMSEQVASVIVEAFCLKYGIHSRDIGFGSFHSNVSPLGGLSTKGMCIYDATHGSLRLTQQLADDFVGVIEFAIKSQSSQENADLNALSALAYLGELYDEMKPMIFTSPTPSSAPTDSEWMQVFAVGERVVYKNGGDLKELFVKGYRYTPAGLMYDLGNEAEKYTTRFSEVLALDDNSKTVEYNLYTGDLRKIPSQ